MGKKHEIKIIYKDKRRFDSIIEGVQSQVMTSLQDFEKVQTSSTCVFETKDEIIRILPENKDLAGYGANFISEVKKHFASLDVPETVCKERPFYDYFVPISTYKEIEDVSEVDINSCYWQSAMKLGYLPESLYQKAFSPNISKKARLIALGVLGKKTVRQKFVFPYAENKNEAVETYEKTRPFWDNIVFEVGEVVRDVVGKYKPHVFGVWFDAVFCSTSIARNISRYMERRGFPASCEKLKGYYIEPRNGLLPGAKITRIFRNGDVKEMDVSYLGEEKKISFDEFLEIVAAV